MTDRGQLDLISLLVNLFLSLLLVHHSHTFYSLLPLSPFSLFISSYFFLLLHLSLSPLPYFVTVSPPFPVPPSFSVSLPSFSSLSLRVNHSFIFLDALCHALALLVILAFFRQLSVILRFAQTSLTRLPLCPSLLYFVYVCMCVSYSRYKVGQSCTC